MLCMLCYVVVVRVYVHNILYVVPILIHVIWKNYYYFLIIHVHMYTLQYMYAVHVAGTHVCVYLYGVVFVSVICVRGVCHYAI